MKIWHQSLTTIDRVPHYRDAIIKHVSRIARPDVEVVLHGMSEETYPSHYPGIFITHSYLQNLHREQFVRAALTAEKAGYDAMFIATIPDVGLLEARTLVDIPVVGYGQASFHMASMLGDHIGVVNFLAPLAEQLRQNADKYGLGGKLGPIVQTEVGFDDIMAGFNDPEPIIESFKKAAQSAIADGADVIIPGEGPMNVFLATHGISRIGDVPVVDSFAAAIKMCESLVDLRKNSGVYMTRKGFYNAKPPVEAVERLREMYGLIPKPNPEDDNGLSVKSVGLTNC
ncbi:aspartate/glutamate racemase family protein [Neobacillus sp. 179-C4.2 HS]|uniref:Aspartate/glutamate racemase family protein n=1 Tax=Neobacillus driksii TaxID=3035913 RepID=A0ABV4YV11_9BACI|nr:aspartate/glutamate racemase family protein [Neobacillus sp. 179.-C4.2 HS]MDP5192573.1 aspartate/glutamate racemase family protein [Neobacillus sp. 179.-C4.2 HS]